MSYATDVLADSPVGYWRLNEPSGSTSADLSGNGLTVNWNPSYFPGETGLLTSDPTATAFRLDATGWGQIAYNAVMNVTPHITVEAWVKPNGGGMVLDRDTDASGGQRLWQFSVSGTGQVNWIWWNAGGGGPYILQSAAGTATTGNISYIAATYDGAAGKVYHNGTLVGTLTQAGSLITGTAPIRIGAHQDNTNGQRYNGVVDEVAFYGTAFSAAKIAARYAAGTAAPVLTDARLDAEYLAVLTQGAAASRVAAAYLAVLTPAQWGPPSPDVTTPGPYWGVLQR